MTDNIIDYGDAISRWTYGFVGRQWLRQAVDGFLSTPEQRCFLLSGEPGIGKTAFLAHLAHERPAYVHHFVSVQESDWNLPAAFVQSVGAQLGRQFGPDLLAEEEPTPLVRADVDVGHAAAGATVVGVLIQQYTALPVEDMARRLILRPVERLAKRQQGPVVLVVDGLEEAVHYSGRPTIAELIVRLASVPNLRIVASSNPGPTLQQLDLELRAAGLQRFAVDESSADNLADLRAYLNTVLDEPAIQQAVQAAKLEPDAFVQRLMERADGNFLYLTTLVNAIRRDPAQVDLESLPASLVEFYQRELLRRKDEAGKIGPATWRREYRPVLGVLAVARASLTMDTLADLAGVERDVAAEVLDSLALLVERRQTGGQPSFRWYHRAVADFLLSKVDNPDDWFDPLTYHRQIADRLHERFPDPAAVDDDYALEHLAAHDRLAGPNAWPRLFALIDPAVRRGWWATTRSDQAFSRALTEAIQAVLTLEPQRSLPLLVRFGLVDATLRSIVAAVPPELLRELARQGQWPQAVALAQLTAGSKGPDLRAVVDGLLDQGSDDGLAVAQQVVALMPSSPDEMSHRGLTLGQIAVRLAESDPDQASALFAQAGQAAAASAGLDTQARALARLGRMRYSSDPVQAAGFFDQALVAARAMTAELDAHAFAGASVAVNVTQTIVEAQYVAERTPYDTIGAKARALADVAAELATVGDPQAKDVFAEAEDLVAQIDLGGAPRVGGPQGIYFGLIFPSDPGIEAAMDVFREHTLEYLASRRQGPAEESTPPPIESKELESRLLAAEQIPSDDKGFHARALAGLAAALQISNDQKQARLVLQRAEDAAEHAVGGFRAELLVKIAGLWRAMGEEETAAQLEQEAMKLAEDEAGFSTQYRAWLARRGRQAVLDLAEIAMTRSGIQKQRYDSDRALAQMVESLAVEDPQAAEALASHIRDPQQSARAHAAVAGHLAQADPARADSLTQSIVDVTAQLPDNQRDFALTGAVQVLARIEPARARRLAEAIGDAASRAFALTLVAAESTDAGQDMASPWEAAWQAAQKAAEPSSSLAGALSRLGEHWASANDPRSSEAWDRAESAALGEPSPSVRVEALTALAFAMSRWVPDRAGTILAQAEEIARQEETLRGRGKGLSGIAAAWMRLDPGRACHLLADLRHLDRPNFLDGVAQIAAGAAELGGVALTWQLVEALAAAEAFYS